LYLVSSRTLICSFAFDSLHYFAINPEPGSTKPRYSYSWIKAIYHKEFIRWIRTRWIALVRIRTTARNMITSGPSLAYDYAKHFLHKYYKIKLCSKLYTIDKRNNWLWKLQQNKKKHTRSKRNTGLMFDQFVRFPAIGRLINGLSFDRIFFV